MVLSPLAMAPDGDTPPEPSDSPVPSPDATAPTAPDPFENPDAYYRNPANVGLNPEADAKYFSDIANVDKNPEANKKFFSGDYKNANTKENFEKYKSFGTEYLKQAHGTTYTLTTLAADFSYSINKETKKTTITNNGKTLDPDQYKDDATIQKIEAVQDGFKIVRKIDDKEQELYVKGDSPQTINYRNGIYSIGDHKFQIGDSKQVAFDFGKDDVKITGQVQGSISVGNEIVEFNNHVGTLTLSVNGNINAENAEVITSQIYADGAFTKNGNEIIATDHGDKNRGNLDPNGRTVIVDRATKVGVTTQGAKTKIHLDTPAPTSVFNPTKTPPAPQNVAELRATAKKTSTLPQPTGEDAEVWIQRDGATGHTLVTTHGKVKVDHYTTPPRPATPAIDETKPSYIGETSTSVSDMRIGPNTEIHTQGKGVYSDRQYSEVRNNQDNAYFKLIRNLGTEQDVFLPTCKGCVVGEPGISLAKKITFRSSNSDGVYYESTTATIDLVATKNGELQYEPNLAQLGLISKANKGMNVISPGRNLVMQVPCGKQKCNFFLGSQGGRFVGQFDSIDGNNVIHQVSLQTDLHDKIGDAIVVTSPENLANMDKMLKLEQDGNLAEIAKANLKFDVKKDPILRNYLFSKFAIDVSRINDQTYLARVTKSLGYRDQAVGFFQQLRNEGLDVDDQGQPNTDEAAKVIGTLYKVQDKRFYQYTAAKLNLARARRESARALQESCKGQTCMVSDKDLKGIIAQSTKEIAGTNRARKQVFSAAEKRITERKIRQGIMPTGFAQSKSQITTIKTKLAKVGSETQKAAQKLAQVERDLADNQRVQQRNLVGCAACKKDPTTTARIQELELKQNRLREQIAAGQKQATGLVGQASALISKHVADRPDAARDLALELGDKNTAAQLNARVAKIAPDKAKAVEERLSTTVPAGLTQNEVAQLRHARVQQFLKSGDIAAASREADLIPKTSGEDTLKEIATGIPFIDGAGIVRAATLKTQAEKMVYEALLDKAGDHQTQVNQLALEKGAHRVEQYEGVFGKLELFTRTFNLGNFYTVAAEGKTVLDVYDEVESRSQKDLIKSADEAHLMQLALIRFRNEGFSPREALKQISSGQVTADFVAGALKDSPRHPFRTKMVAHKFKRVFGGNNMVITKNDAFLGVISAEASGNTPSQEQLAAAELAQLELKRTSNNYQVDLDLEREYRAVKFRYGGTLAAQSADSTLQNLEGTAENPLLEGIGAAVGDKDLYKKVGLDVTKRTLDNFGDIGVSVTGVDGIIPGFLFAKGFKAASAGVKVTKGVLAAKVALGAEKLVLLSAPTAKAVIKTERAARKVAEIGAKVITNTQIRLFASAETKSALAAARKGFDFATNPAEIEAARKVLQQAETAISLEVAARSVVVGSRVSSNGKAIREASNTVQAELKSVARQLGSASGDDVARLTKNAAELQDNAKTLRLLADAEKASRGTTRSSFLRSVRGSESSARARTVLAEASSEFRVTTQNLAPSLRAAETSDDIARVLVRVSDDAEEVVRAGKSLDDVSRAAIEVYETEGIIGKSVRAIRGSKLPKTQSAKLTVEVTEGAARLVAQGAKGSVQDGLFRFTDVPSSLRREADGIEGIINTHGDAERFARELASESDVASAQRLATRDFPAPPETDLVAAREVDLAISGSSDVKVPVTPEPTSTGSNFAGCATGDPCDLTKLTGPQDAAADLQKKTVGFAPKNSEERRLYDQLATVQSRRDTALGDLAYANQRGSSQLEADASIRLSRTNRELREAQEKARELGLATGSTSEERIFQQRLIDLERRAESLPVGSTEIKTVKEEITNLKSSVSRGHFKDSVSQLETAHRQASSKLEFANKRLDAIKVDYNNPNYLNELRKHSSIQNEVRNLQEEVAALSVGLKERKAIAVKNLDVAQARKVSLETELAKHKNIVEAKQRAGVADEAYTISRNRQADIEYELFDLEEDLVKLRQEAGVSPKTSRNLAGCAPFSPDCVLDSNTYELGGKRYTYHPAIDEWKDIDGRILVAKDNVREFTALEAARTGQTYNQAAKELVALRILSEMPPPLPSSVKATKVETPVPSRAFTFAEPVEPAQILDIAPTLNANELVYNPAVDQLIRAAKGDSEVERLANAYYIRYSDKKISTAKIPISEIEDWTQPETLYKFSKGRDKIELSSIEGSWNGIESVRKPVKEGKLRFFINSKNSESSDELMIYLAKQLDAEGIPFQMKTSNLKSQFFERTDNTVLYFNGADQARVTEIMENLPSSLTSKLDPEVPQFSKKLRDGISLAEDSPDFRSFGEMRTDALAEIRLNANGITGKELDDYARTVFIKHGVDPDNLWRNYGSTRTADFNLPKPEISIPLTALTFPEVVEPARVLDLKPNPTVSDLIAEDVASSVIRTVDDSDRSLLQRGYYSAYGKKTGTPLAEGASPIINPQKLVELTEKHPNIKPTFDVSNPNWAFYLTDTYTPGDGKIRFYLNAKDSDSAIASMTSIAEKLDGQGIPFQMKTFSRTDRFATDSANTLFYVSKENQAAVERIILDTINPSHLDPQSPFLTKQLAPGISWAESPVNGRVSFGRSRANTLAEIKLQSKGLSPDEVKQLTRRIFTQNNIDPDAPWLNLAHHYDPGTGTWRQGVAGPTLTKESNRAKFIELEAQRLGKTKAEVELNLFASAPKKFPSVKVTPDVQRSGRTLTEYNADGRKYFLGSDDAGNPAWFVEDDSGFANGVRAFFGKEPKVKRVFNSEIPTNDIYAIEGVRVGLIEDAKTIIDPTLTPRGISDYGVKVIPEFKVGENTYTVFQVDNFRYYLDSEGRIFVEKPTVGNDLANFFRGTFNRQPKLNLVESGAYTDDIARIENYRFPNSLEVANANKIAVSGEGRLYFDAGTTDLSKVTFSPDPQGIKTGYLEVENFNLYDARIGPMPDVDDLIKQGYHGYISPATSSTADGFYDIRVINSNLENGYDIRVIHNPTPSEVVKVTAPTRLQPQQLEAAERVLSDLTGTTSVGPRLSPEIQAQLRASPNFVGEGVEGIVLRLADETRSKLGLERPTLIKISKGADGVQPFEQQAAILNRLADAEIAPRARYVNDVDGVIPTIYVDEVVGRTLKQLSIEEYNALAPQIEELVETLIGQNIYIRDLHASNIILTDSGKLMVIDVGAAFEVSSTNARKLYGTFIDDFRSGSASKPFYHDIEGAFFYEREDGALFRYHVNKNTGQTTKRLIVADEATKARTPLPSGVDKIETNNEVGRLQDAFEARKNQVVESQGAAGVKVPAPTSVPEPPARITAPGSIEESVRAPTSVPPPSVSAPTSLEARGLQIQDATTGSFRPATVAEIRVGETDKVISDSLYIATEDLSIYDPRTDAFRRATKEEIASAQIPAPTQNAIPPPPSIPPPSTPPTDIPNLFSGKDVEYTGNIGKVKVSELSPSAQKFFHDNDLVTESGQIEFTIPEVGTYKSIEADDSQFAGTILEEIGLWRATKFKDGKGNYHFLKVAIDEKYEQMLGRKLALSDTARRQKFAEALMETLGFKFPKTKLIKTDDGLTIIASPVLKDYNSLGKGASNVRLHEFVISQNIPPDVAARLTNELRQHAAFNLWSSASDVELGVAKFDGLWHITRVDDEAILAGAKLADKTYGVPHKSKSVGPGFKFTELDYVYGNLQKSDYVTNGVLNTQKFDGDFNPIIAKLNGLTETASGRNELNNMLRTAGYGPDETSEMIAQLSRGNLKGNIEQTIWADGRIVISEVGSYYSNNQFFVEWKLRELGVPANEIEQIVAPLKKGDFAKSFEDAHDLSIGEFVTGEFDSNPLLVPKAVGDLPPSLEEALVRRAAEAERVGTPPSLEDALAEIPPPIPFERPRLTQPLSRAEAPHLVDAGTPPPLPERIPELPPAIIQSGDNAFISPILNPKTIQEVEWNDIVAILNKDNPTSADIKKLHNSPYAKRDAEGVYLDIPETILKQSNLDVAGPSVIRIETTGTSGFSNVDQAAVLHHFSDDGLTPIVYASSNKKIGLDFMIQEKVDGVELGRMLKIQPTETRVQHIKRVKFLKDKLKGVTDKLADQGIVIDDIERKFIVSRTGDIKLRSAGSAADVDPDVARGIYARYDAKLQKGITDFEAGIPPSLDDAIAAKAADELPPSLDDALSTKTPLEERTLIEFGLRVPDRVGFQSTDGIESTIRVINKNEVLEESENFIRTNDLTGRYRRAKGKVITTPETRNKLSNTIIHDLDLWQTGLYEKNDGSWVFLKLVWDEKAREKGLVNFIDTGKRQRGAEVVRGSFSIKVEKVKQLPSGDGLNLQAQKPIVDYHELGKLDSAIILKQYIADKKFDPNQASNLWESAHRNTFVNFVDQFGDSELALGRLDGKLTTTVADDELAFNKLYGVIVGNEWKETKNAIDKLKLKSKNNPASLTAKQRELVGSFNPLQMLEDGQTFTKSQKVNAIPSNDRLYGTIDKSVYRTNGGIDEPRFKADFSPLIEEWETGVNSITKQNELRANLKNIGFTEGQIDDIITNRRTANPEKLLRKYILSDFDFLVANPFGEPKTVEEFYRVVSRSEIDKLEEDFIERTIANRVKQKTQVAEKPIDFIPPPARKSALRETVAIKKQGDLKGLDEVVPNCPIGNIVGCAACGCLRPDSATSVKKFLTRDEEVQRAYKAESNIDDNLATFATKSGKAIETGTLTDLPKKEGLLLYGEGSTTGYISKEYVYNSRNQDFVPTTFSLNAKSSDAGIQLTTKVADELRNSGIPFELNIPTTKKDFSTRVDTVRIVVDSKDTKKAENILAKIAEQNGNLLDPEIPTISKPIAPGVALESVGYGAQFRERRASAIADLQTVIAKRGDVSDEEIVDLTRGFFMKHNIDPNEPWKDLGFHDAPASIQLDRIIEVYTPETTIVVQKVIRHKDGIIVQSGENMYFVNKEGIKSFSYRVKHDAKLIPFIEESPQLKKQFLAILDDVNEGRLIAEDLPSNIKSALNVREIVKDSPRSLLVASGQFDEIFINPFGTHARSIEKVVEVNQNNPVLQRLNKIMRESNILPQRTVIHPTGQNVLSTTPTHQISTGFGEYGASHKFGTPSIYYRVYSSEKELLDTSRMFGYRGSNVDEAKILVQEGAAKVSAGHETFHHVHNAVLTPEQQVKWAEFVSSQRSNPIAESLEGIQGTYPIGQHADEIFARRMHAYTFGVDEFSKPVKFSHPDSEEIRLLKEFGVLSQDYVPPIKKVPKVNDVLPAFEQKALSLVDGDTARVEGGAILNINGKQTNMHLSGSLSRYGDSRVGNFEVIEPYSRESLGIVEWELDGDYIHVFSQDGHVDTLLDGAESISPNANKMEIILSPNQKTQVTRAMKSGLSRDEAMQQLSMVSGREKAGWKYSSEISENGDYVVVLVKEDESFLTSVFQIMTKFLAET